MFGAPSGGLRSGPELQAAFQNTQIFFSGRLSESAASGAKPVFSFQPLLQETSAKVTKNVLIITRVCPKTWERRHPCRYKSPKNAGKDAGAPMFSVVGEALVNSAAG